MFIDSWNIFRLNFFIQGLIRTLYGEKYEKTLTDNGICKEIVNVFYLLYITNTDITLPHRLISVNLGFHYGKFYKLLSKENLNKENYIHNADSSSSIMILNPPINAIYQKGHKYQDLSLVIQYNGQGGHVGDHISFGYLLVNKKIKNNFKYLDNITANDELYKCDNNNKSIINDNINDNIGYIGIEITPVKCYYGMKEPNNIEKIYNLTDYDNVPALWRFYIYKNKYLRVCLMHNYHNIEKNHLYFQCNTERLLNPKKEDSVLINNEFLNKYNLYPFCEFRRISSQTDICISLDVVLTDRVVDDDVKSLEYLFK